MVFKDFNPYFSVFDFQQKLKQLRPDRSPKCRELTVYPELLKHAPPRIKHPCILLPLALLEAVWSTFYLIEKFLLCILPPSLDNLSFAGHSPSDFDLSYEISSSSCWRFYMKKFDVLISLDEPFDSWFLASFPFLFSVQRPKFPSLLSYHLPCAFLRYPLLYVNVALLNHLLEVRHESH